MGKHTGAIDWINTKDPEHLFYVAHSVGGQVLGLADNCGSVDQALFVASQSGYHGHWPITQRAPVWILWHILIPTLTPIMGYFPSRIVGMGEPLPKGVARQWASWGRNPHYIHKHNQPWRPHHNEVKASITFLSFDDDHIAPKPTVQALMDFYPNAEKTHDHLEAGLGHFGFFRDGGPWMEYLPK